MAEENEARVSVELWTGTDLDALTPTPFFPPRFRGEPSGLVLLCLRRFCFGEPFGVLLPLLPLPFFFRRRCFGDDGIAPWPGGNVMTSYQIEVRIQRVSIEKQGACG